MSLKEQIESGKVFTEYGHTAQEDLEYEKIIEAQRRKSKQLCFRYNQTDPMDEEGREKLVRELLSGTGKTLWLEAPIHFAYGCDVRAERDHQHDRAPRPPVLSDAGRALFPAGRH